MSAALDNLLRLYGDVLDFLRKELDSDRPANAQAKAKDLYERMLDIEIMSALHVIYSLVQILALLSKKMQTRDLRHEAAYEAIELAKESIADEYIQGGSEAPPLLNFFCLLTSYDNAGHSLLTVMVIFIIWAFCTGEVDPQVYMSIF